MDKTRQKHLIEVELIALRYCKSVKDEDDHDYNDPFILYQDGIISKRKLIEIIATHLAKEL
jgi:hypothetical protein